MGGVAWTEEEDHLLKKCIERYGEGKWHRIPVLAGLNRCRKSCRLRWLNYLRPNIKRGSFAEEEVNLIVKLHNLLGNRWSLIAGRLPGRTANDVKNYWNCHLSKKLINAEDQTAITTRPHPSIVTTTTTTTTTGSTKPRSSADHMSPNKQARTIMWMPFQEVVNEEDGPCLGVTEPGRFVGDLSTTDHQFGQFDEGGCSKWEWDDLVLDMDLWTSSL